MRKILTIVVLASFAGASFLACNYESDEELRRRSRNGGAGADGENGGEGDQADPTKPGACQVGTPHVGFGNTDFVAKREIGGLGVDRRRIKPFSSLEREFERVLGTKPAGLAASASAFGAPQDRWYAEPVAGAVTVYTTYSVAFTACYDKLADANYGQMPTEATAKTECASLQRKAWLRNPSQEETSGCVDLVMNKLSSESVARRRWAHLCASILTSDGFITY